MRLGLESEEKPPRGSWERASQTAGGREAGRPAGLRGRVGQVPGAAAEVAATMRAGRPNWVRALVLGAAQSNCRVGPGG